MKSFVCDKNGKLVKIALERVEGLSFSAMQKLLRDKDVKINGKRVKEDVKVQVGDRVEIYVKDAPIIKYDAIYKDDNIFVINKKSGYTSESVFESVKAEEKSAEFIHRLDRNTSGIMIFALNEDAEKELLSGFKERTFEKKYIAEVLGTLDKKEDILTAYLVKDSDLSSVKIFNKEVKGSVPIKTGYKVLSETKETSKLLVTLYTGKTHQIRAHLAFIGHPIIGDGKYGDNQINKKLSAKTQRLKAVSLTLNFNKESVLFYLDKKTFSIDY